ncbi:unnamed protein product [Rhizophagus irregularis]|nr:unnamed protein product [Rhizophagus irregularis]
MIQTVYQGRFYLLRIKHLRVNMQYVLKFEDVSKLEGQGWIEYFFKMSILSEYMQPSIEVNGINMQVDYIRFIRFVDDESRKDGQIYFPKMARLL